MEIVIRQYMEKFFLINVFNLMDIYQQTEQ